MSKSMHSEAQIIGALKQVEAGRAVEDLAREYRANRVMIQLGSPIRISETMTLEGRLAYGGRSNSNEDWFGTPASESKFQLVVNY